MTTALRADRMTLADAYRLLGYTEGLAERAFKMTKDAKVQFVLDEAALKEHGTGHAMMASERHPYVSFHIGSDEYPLSQEGLRRAFKESALPAKLTEELPLNLTIPILNHQFATLGSERKALIHDDMVVTFARPSTEIYSTVRLLKALVEDHMDEDNVFILNFSHTIEETHMTVLDETLSTKLDDGSVLVGGIQFQTSVLALKPLQLDMFVLRMMERDTAGDVEIYQGGSMSGAVQSVKWNRKADAKRAELPAEQAEKMLTAYKFVGQTTSDMLRQLHEEFDRVSALADVRLDQHVGPYLNDILEKHGVPPRLYNPVMQEYSHSESSRAALDLWMGFGHVGLTDLEIDARLRRMLFSVAGEIAAHPDLCDNCHRSLPSAPDFQ